VATAGNAQASVAFNAPSSNGGSAITGYTVTSSPGGITATGANSPLAVTGLATNIAYTFTVVATNAAGNSVASVASGSVSPFGIVNNPTTNKIWMDRNLGATAVATSRADAAAYGDLYQWGRGTDGHQLRNSPTTTTLSSSAQPGNNMFILTSAAAPSDWRSTQSVNLWQGVNGINNPCPTGYRIPTAAEWRTEHMTWSSQNGNGAFASTLKLPLAGIRDAQSGQLTLVGEAGLFWSSTIIQSNSEIILFDSGYDDYLFIIGFQRANGFSIRCIKD
jgi:hypothetical protein